MDRSGSILAPALSACLLLALVQPLHGGEGLDPDHLVDGRFYSVSQPAQQEEPAADSSQQPAPRRTRPTPQPSAQARSFGGARAPQSAAPSMIGDFFGASQLQIVLQPPAVVINTQQAGFARSANFDDPDTPLQFALNPNGPVVLITAPPAIDVSGDGIVDTYPLAGVPPALTPPAPGPGTLVLNPGGVVAFTQGTGNAVNGRPAGSTGGVFFPGYEALLSHTFTPARVIINAPNPSGGGVVGRIKIAENNSPLPRDRVFHNFSYFDNVPLAAGGVNVSRFIPGFEKTFFGGVMSVEMRFPFASTLDPTIMADGGLNTDEAEFGNINIPIKVLVYQNPIVAWSGGLAVSLPTADDTVVQLANGTQLARIENESVHLMPFLACLYTPNDRFFAQAFVQVDADTRGNPLLVTDFAGGLRDAGRLEDVTYLYADLGIGYWFHRSESTRGLTGFAPTLELHWNRSLDDVQVVRTGNVQVGSLNGSFDTMNLVVGSMLEWNRNTSLTLGFATPVSGGVDREFDGELRVILNHRFGPQTRASRAQF